MRAASALQVVGHLRPEVAAELGLTEEVAVAPGSGDNQMSALGAGAVKEGDWVISLGTSGAPPPGDDLRRFQIAVLVTPACGPNCSGSAF